MLNKAATKIHNELKPDSIYKFQNTNVSKE